MDIWIYYMKKLYESKKMSYKKATLITALIWLSAILVILASCSPKTNCGTKKQHKARQANTKKMAPRMVN